MASIGGRLIWQRSQIVPDKPRREFLRATATTVAVAPFAAAGYGRYVAQRDPRVREVDVTIPDLHPDLAGLRLVQISDLHMSDFVPRREIRRAVEVANELRPHLTFITGDLITAAGDPLDDCIDELSLLRSDAGVFGCLGNHEIVAGAEDYTTARCARAGIPILRGTNKELRFGSGRINLAGVNYQRRGTPYLAGVQTLISPGSLNLLLSHNPDVFPIAARQGWDLTLAGHTHGGQVTLEYLHPALNPARFYTPYVYGLYRLGRNQVYVTSGVGTIGVPVRLNTEPEIVFMRLRSV
jgi:predicted MPP superfamily phosphohydrolase